MQLIKSE